MSLSFEEMNLSQPVLKALHEMGFEKPMPIQAEVIPAILEGETDITALAQTGTGKTGAFGLPLVELADPKDKTTRSLILCPTRELCLQIAKELSGFAKYKKGVSVLPLYGGAPITTQIKELTKGVQIVVATPGRMLDLLKRKKVNVSNVEHVVFDEADEMLNMGFREDLDAILKYVPQERQSMLFSATMSKEVSNIAKKYMKQPLEVIIGEKNKGSSDVRFVYTMIKPGNRFPALKRIIDMHPDIYAIIFCRTRRDSKEVAEKLIAERYNADCLHGDMSQAQRDQVMKRFRMGNLKLLVATDVAARGLDVPELTHVIHYNLPDESESFTHRSGRTGRAGKKGISIAIVQKKDIFKLKRIEKILKTSFEKEDLPAGSQVFEKKVFHFFDKIEHAEAESAAIDKVLPSLSKKLEYLSKEELLRKLIALEFPDFLNKTSEKNLNDSSEDFSRKKKSLPAKKKEKSPRKEQAARKPADGIVKAEKGFVRFYLNIGHKSGLTPEVLIGLVKERTKKRNVNIGKIDIMKKFSFFEVEESAASLVKPGFEKKKFAGEELFVEEATQSVGATPRKTKKRKSTK